MGPAPATITPLPPDRKGLPSTNSASVTTAATDSSSTDSSSTDETVQLGINATKAVRITHIDVRRDMSSPMVAANRRDRATAPG